MAITKLYYKHIRHFFIFLVCVLWEQVTPTASFQKDLGLDSLDTVEVVMAFEEEFAVEIPDSEADKILSTADAINYIAAHPQAKWANAVQRRIGL
jgi:acyl carrier protein